MELEVIIMNYMIYDRVPTEDQNENDHFLRYEVTVLF